MERLIINQDGPVLWLTVNRPEVRNALNTAVLGELAAKMVQADADPAVRVMVVTGAGGQFAAGADIDEIADKGSIEGMNDPRKEYWRAIQSVTKPVIAAVEGYCLGGGCELALSADLLVVAEDAQLGQPEIRLGLIPGAGGLHRLAVTLGKARAMRLALMGESISGHQAYEWGLASHLCATGEAQAQAEQLARTLGKGAPLAQQLAKAAVLDATESAHDAGMAQARANFERLLGSNDKKEGIAAFREKRRPNFSGD